MSTRFDGTAFSGTVWILIIVGCAWEIEYGEMEGGGLSLEVMEGISWWKGTSLYK